MLDACPDALLRVLFRRPPRGVPQARWQAELERDLAMLSSRCRGLTWTEVAQAYGLTCGHAAQRVTQLERRIEGARIACRRRGIEV